MQRAHFNKQSQKPGESADTFIQDLHRLANNCNYDTLKDDLIRDRIVVGVVDDSLSDQRQSNASLTLAEAVQMSHQAESRAQNRDLVRGDNKPAQVEFVNSGKSEIKNHPTKRLRKLPNPVAGVATKDTTAKLVPLKLLPVTIAAKEDIFKAFVAALPPQQIKYTSLKKTKSRKRETKFYLIVNI